MRPRFRNCQEVLAAPLLDIGQQRNERPALLRKLPHSRDHDPCPALAECHRVDWFVRRSSIRSSEAQSTLSITAVEEHRAKKSDSQLPIFVVNSSPLAAYRTRWLQRRTTVRSLATASKFILP